MDGMILSNSDQTRKKDMTAFTQTPRGFRAAPGRYAFVAQDWTGEVPDPRDPAVRPNALAIPAGEGARTGSYDGLEFLVLPVGLDAGGCPGRTIAVGGRSLVVFETIVLVAIPEDAVFDVPNRSYPFASHCDSVVVVDFVEGGEIVLDDPEGDDEYIGLVGCRDLNGTPILSIDPWTPGAFDIEADFIDMTDPVTAQAFDYGSDAFNAKLDEHGFHADLDAVRARLRARTDNEGIALLSSLEGLGRFRIVHYAPVAE